MPLIVARVQLNAAVTARLGAVNSQGMWRALFFGAAFMASAALGCYRGRIQGSDLAGGAAADVVVGSGKPVVVAFLSSSCPCSASHEPELSRLAKRFPAFRFVGVHANADETSEEGTRHFRSAGLPFPVVRDGAATLADAFGALKTPHVYVVGADGACLYQGGVDDSQLAEKARTRHLENALEAISAGRSPAVSQARALGCRIARP